MGQEKSEAESPKRIELCKRWAPRSWSRIPSATQNFSLSHARHKLNIPSYQFFFLTVTARSQDFFPFLDLGRGCHGDGLALIEFNNINHSFVTCTLDFFRLIDPVPFPLRFVKYQFFMRETLGFPIVLRSTVNTSIVPS